MSTSVRDRLTKRLGLLEQAQNRIGAAKDNPITRLQNGAFAVKAPSEAQPIARRLRRA
jgi:hypothetical protein